MASKTVVTHAQFESYQGVEEVTIRLIRRLGARVIISPDPSDIPGDFREALVKWAWPEEPGIHPVSARPAAVLGEHPYDPSVVR